MSLDGLPEVPFVGRERELAEFERVLGEVSSGKPHVLAIGGEGGIGKTTIAARGAELAKEAGFRVIWCRLDESQATRPYMLWLAMIHVGLRQRRKEDGRHPRGVDAREGEIVFGPSWPAVAPLLRDFFADDGDAVPRSSQGTEITSSRQQDIFDGFVSFLRYLSTEHKVLLVIDNLHVADEDSLAALEIAGTEIEDGHLMMVLTYRTTVPSSIDGALADVLGTLSHNGNVIRMRLSRFGLTHVRELLRRTQTDDAEGAVDLIFELSEGNPLLVHELLRLMRTGSADLGRHMIEESDLSRRARKTVSVRCETLTKRQRRILITAAAAGREVKADLIAALWPSTDRDEIDATMQEASRLGIVVEVSSSSPRYRFSHAIIRDAVLSLAGPTEQKRVTAHIARRLEEFYGANAEAHADELYLPFLSSDDSEDVRRGICYALAAGNRALEQLAWKRARSIFGGLLEGYNEKMRDDERAAALLGMGKAYSRSVDRVRAAECFRTAFEYYRSVHDFDRLAEIALHPIDIDLGDDLQFPLIEEATKLVPVDHPRHFELLCEYAYGLFEAKDRYEDAEALNRELLEQARTLGAREVEPRLRLQAANLHIRYSRFDDAIAAATEVLAHVAVEPNTFLESHANFLSMQAYLLKGEIAEAKRFAYRSSDSVVPLRDGLLTATGIAHVTRFELRAGNWTEVERETNRGLDVAPNNPFLLPLRAMAEYYQGRIEVGDGYLERLMRASEGYPTPRTLIFASILLLIAHRWEITRRTKYLNRARSLLTEMLSIDLVLGVEIRTRIAQALLAYQAGDVVEAQRASDLLSAMPTYNLIRQYRIDRTLGLIGSLQENYDRAARHYLEAIAACNSIRDLPVLAWTYADYGDLLSDPNSFGSHADAQDAYGKALTIALKLKMRPLVERVERSLRRLGERAPSGDESLFGKPLSARELQVLALVAEGRTDVQIARELGISVYTASNHVRHILRKTGGDNRIEAVRFAERTGLL